MAFVNCPKCGAMLPDKIKECPNCGYITEEKSKDRQQEKADKQIKKQMILGGMAIVAAILIISSFFFGKNEQNTSQNTAEINNVTQSNSIIEIDNITKSDKVAENDNITEAERVAENDNITEANRVAEINNVTKVDKVSGDNNVIENNDLYMDVLNEAKSKMFFSMIACESSIGMISDVLRSAIYRQLNGSARKYVLNEDSSYNDVATSLQNLFEDSLFSATVDSLKEDKEMINIYIDKIQNPPEEFKNCYDMIIELNEIYNTIFNLVIDPAHSVKNYGEYDHSYNSLRINFEEKYDVLSNCLKEVKNKNLG